MSKASKKLRKLKDKLDVLEEKEQDILEDITKDLSLNNNEKSFINCLNDINKNLEKAKIQLDNNENNKAKDTINSTVILIKSETNVLVVPSATTNL